MDAFREIGIEVYTLPEGSYVDFEFQISKDLIGVCETKGLQGAANVSDLRQLLQYFIEQRDIEHRNVKGVFIVNHFRDINPKERGNPLTKDALELVKKHNFCLMTTKDLYELIIKFIEQRLKKEDFLKIFF